MMQGGRIMIWQGGCRDREWWSTCDQGYRGGGGAVVGACQNRHSKQPKFPNINAVMQDMPQIGSV
jgi:hypothetical protein